MDFRLLRSVAMALTFCLALGGATGVSVVAVAQAEESEADRKAAEKKAAEEKEAAEKKEAEEAFAAAREAYGKGDYAEALRLFRPIADSPHVGRDVQYWIGQMHYYGLGPLAQNEREAVDWYSRAASRGSSDAQYRLGHLHSRGLGGVEQSPQKAVGFWRHAAKNGHVLSMLRMADNYETGAFLPKNERQARFWYREAARRGNVEGMVKLAMNLQGTEQLPRDYTRAYMWLVVAKARGSREADGLMKRLKLKFHGEEIEKAEELAKEFLQKGKLPPRMKNEM